MRIRIFLLISASALFFDQITKLIIQKTMVPYQVKPFIDDIVRFILVYNPRGVFGLSIASGISYYVLQMLGIAIVLFFAFRTKSYFYLSSYALIMGGALGNLWDRIRLGKVVDFIDMGIKNVRWFTYNLADLFIVAGIVLLIWAEIFRAKPQPAKSEPEQSKLEIKTQT